MTADLKVLYESNFRDVAKTLRKIADEVEAGDYGNVGSCGISLIGDQLHVFGCGPDSEPPSVALLLHAGFLRLSKSLEEHGQDGIPFQ